MSLFQSSIKKSKKKHGQICNQNKELNKYKTAKKSKLFKIESKKRKDKKGIKLSKRNKVIKNYLKNKIKNLKIQKGGSLDILNLKYKSIW